MSGPSSAQPAAEEIRLPSFFPLTAPKCKEVTKTFFECFNKHTKELDEAKDDVNKSLALCLSEMTAYEKCMSEHIAREERRGRGLWGLW